MRTWRYEPVKPARRALERKRAQVRYRLQTKYPTIKEQARTEGATIRWGGETGLRSDRQAGTT